MHNVFNYNPMGLPYDTITTCISYADATGYSTCCVAWIWDGTSWMLMSMAQPTAINELNSSNRELLKVVDILGRNANEDKNKPLFYIYNDGTVEKKIILE
jgi:hypothetical protein